MAEPRSSVSEMDRPPARDPGAAVASRPRGVARTRWPGKTLFGYLAKSLLVNCSMSFLILEAVQGIIFTVRATEGYSFDILIIFPVLLAAFAMAVSYALPLAMLFGTSLLMGRLNADREVLALRSFGLSAAQMALPAVAVGSVLTLGSYYFNTEWAPAMRFANRHAETLILDRLGYLGEGWSLEYKSSEMTLWVNHYDGPVLEGIFVSSGSRGSTVLLSNDVLERVHAPSYPLYFFAERGLVARGTGKYEGQLVIELQGVSLFFDEDVIGLMGKDFQPGGADPDPKQKEAAEPKATKASDDTSNFMHRLRLDRFLWPIKFPERTPTVKDMSSSELREATEDRWKKLEDARKSGKPDDVSYAEGQYWYAVTEFHRRLGLSLTSLFFPLSAFVIGLFITSNNRLLPFFISTSIVPSLYFGCEMFGNSLARKGIAPWATEQLGNGVLLAVIGLLVWRLARTPRG